MNIFFVFIIFVGLVTSRINAEDCQLKEKCECVFADGSGISLKNVIDGNKYLEAKYQNNQTFFFHPCGDVTTLPNIVNTTEDNCKRGYELCAWNYENVNNTKTIVLGAEKDMSFKRDNDGKFRIVYFTADSKESSISLECAPNTKESILHAPIDLNVDQVNLMLFSKHACITQIEIIKHPGFFYTLFIVILTLALAYLVIGMMVNYFLIGARGYELVPNLDFWKKVWLSMRLAFMYVKNGCRVVPTEDTYDAI